MSSPETRIRTWERVTSREAKKEEKEREMKNWVVCEATFELWFFGGNFSDVGF